MKDKFIVPKRTHSLENLIKYKNKTKIKYLNDDIDNIIDMYIIQSYIIKNK